tara:strand:+ start:4873 stop:6318 length:1446 start_codon:yes stop_codon:yes gene_type:complete
MMATDAIKSVNSNFTGSTTNTITPTQGLRRRHNFGDRVYKLTPEETPFFVYLNAVSKMPTDDPVFRVLEDREQISWTDRTFQFTIAQNDTIKIEEGDNESWTYNDADDSPDGGELADIPVVDGSKLVAGMVIQYVAWNSEVPEQIFGRIHSVSGNTIQVKTVKQDKNSPDAAITLTGAAGGSKYDFQVIGSAFAEGTGAPDSFGYGIDDTYGLTQIFKTTCSMTNTAYATMMRGYSKEWDRIWAMKLREHKVDIERAFLFNNKGVVNGVQYTDGILGSILNSGAVNQSTASTKLAYESGKPYIRTIDIAAGSPAVNELTYDSFLEDMEVIFDPARGGSSEKFCMASLPVITLFNKMQGGYLQNSAGDSGPYRYNMSFEDKTGGFGHKVMRIETVHGSLNMVKQPLFRGIAKNSMLCVDLNNVKYRPLVGNGLNRDTYIDTNVQLPDEDLRKDLILTEAGLEVCMPESHALFNFVSAGTPIG